MQYLGALSYRNDSLLQNVDELWKNYNPQKPQQALNNFHW
jgi:hypothetical protein